MQIVFRLAYSGVVALLFALSVILGTRTFYGEPHAPTYPTPVGDFSNGPPPITCKGELCYRNLTMPPSTPEDTQPLTLDEARKLYPEAVKQQEEAERAQSDYNARYQTYQDDRADYRRNVFIAATAFGVAAVCAGLYLFRRVEAMPLGLLLGGIGVVIFGWIQAADDFDKVVTLPIFLVATAGLVVVLAAGYRVLGKRAGSSGDGA